jgi:hypothetical protein
MNKYDNITSILNKNPVITDDSTYLIIYINTYLYRTMNSEKIEDFYNHIPQILDKIFYISARLKFQDKKVKIYSTLVDQLEKGQIEDFDRMFSMLAPLDKKNLFTAISMPPDHDIPEYKLDASILGVCINHLILQHRQDYLMSLFDDMTKSIKVQKAALLNGNIILNVFEYFILYFLIAIRDYQGKSKVSLSKANEKFSDTLRASYKPMTKELMSDLDLHRSVGFNFYYLLFNSILSHIAEGRTYEDMLRLRFIVTGVDITWLSDYYIGNRLLDNRIIDNISIPNLAVLECLLSLIRTLQQRNNGIITNDGFNLECLLFRIQRQLYYFFKQNFKKIYIETLNTEVTINDLIKVWFAYITPWYENGIITFPYIQNYIFYNLLIYIDLFNDYIINLAYLGIHSQSVIVSLSQVMNLYSISDNREIINSQLRLDILKDLSMGKSSSGYSDVDSHLKFIGCTSKSVLYPFDIPENKEKAKTIYQNLDNWRNKLSKELIDSDKELLDFLEKLRNTQTNLARLYDLESGVMMMDYFEKTERTKEIKKTPNIYTHRNVIDLTNPWKRRIGSNESTLLFYLFKFVAYYVDRWKGIPIYKDTKGNIEPPTTDLRHLSSYYSLLSGLILLAILYLMIRLLIALIKL